jgi:hypothetical protein
MADLTGLPDFAAMITSSEASLFAPFVSGSYSALPRQLQLATNADGSPKFEIDFAKTIGDASSIAQFAELDFSLAGDYALDSALSMARAKSPAATVRPATMDGGFGRLYAAAGAVPLPADLLSPIPLGWGTTDLAHWFQRMSGDAGELLKGALQGQSSLLFGARVEVSVLGVAPRLETYVQFDPAALLAALLAGHAGRSMAVTDVLSFFTAPLSTYPVTVSAVPDGGNLNLAQIMTDRVIASYADLTPSPGVADSAFVQFRPMNQIDTAVTRWDLNEPTQVMRPWVFMLDPIGSVRALNDPAVLASVVKEVTFPALNLGCYRVYLTANLPRNRSGIAAVGTRVEMPPNPPVRPFSISKTALFTPPDDSGYVDLALGATEALAYSVTCFGVIAAGAFVQQYDSAPQAHTGSWVQLSGDDFPLNFANVIASARLLNLATIHGVLSYQVGTHQVQQPFTLAAGSGSGAEVTVGAPAIASGVSIALQALPLDGGNAVSLPATAGGRIELDLHSFAGYGPHTVTVQCHMDTHSAPLFIECIPELQATNAQTIPSKVALTAEQPSAAWGYVATSPFRPGYCYRVAAATGSAPASWSAPRLPDDVLMLEADGMLQEATNTTSGEGPPAGAGVPTQVPSLTQ